MRRDAKQALSECADCAARLSSPVVMCFQIISILNRYLGYERGAIVLRRDRQQPLVLVAHCPGQNNPVDHELEMARVQALLNGPDLGVISSVIAKGQTIRLGKIDSASNYIEGSPHVRSELCVPLISAGSTIGAFNVEADTPDYFSADDELLLTVVATIVAGPLSRLPVMQMV